MHGLIPEEPRFSASRSIARLLIIFLDALCFWDLYFYLYLYLYLDFDVCIIFSAHLNLVNQPYPAVVLSLI